MFHKFFQINLVAVVCIVMVNCSSGAKVENAGSTQAAGTPTTAPSATTAPGGGTSSTSKTLTDIKKIVSFGDGIAFNQLTGGPNDIALNPSTKQPAVAYFDKSSAISGAAALGGLKYAYADANGHWNIEVVDANYGSAACGSAGATCVGASNGAAGANNSNIIAIAFKSTGLPAIAYVYGNSTAAGKSVKFAERTSAGVWNIATIDYSGYANVNNTNDPIKAVTLMFDSSDRPHVTFAFFHSVLTSSQLVYAYRPTTTTTWTSYNVASIWTGGAAGLGAGVNQAQTAICPVDGTIYATTSVSTGAAASTATLLKCTPDSTGGCPNVGSWTTTTMTAALSLPAHPALVTAGIGGGREGVVISSGNKVIIGALNAAAGINFAVSNETCNTALASLTWTAATTQITTANAGINGFDMTLAGTNVLVSYGIDSTSVEVAKSTEALAGFAVADRITAETVVVGNDGTGIVYDASNDIFYSSYAAIPAAAAGAIGNDIKVAYGFPADIANTATQLTITQVDQTNRVFASTSTPVLAAAKAPDGTIGYTHFFQDMGATPSSTSRLYYGEKVGTGKSAQFTNTLVYNFGPSAASANLAGTHPALAYDSNSNPVISFLDNESGNGLLMVARSNNKGLSFAVDWVDGAGATTVGRHSAVATYGDVIGVSYQDYANTGLKFARWKPGSGWRKFVVDGMTGATGTGCSTGEVSGAFSAMRWTSDGRPVIMYQSDPSAIKSLKIAYATESSTSATYTWTCTTVDASGNSRGEGIDFVLDSSDKPHITHLDLTQGASRYVTCASAIKTCLSSGSSAFTGERITLLGTVTTVANRPSIVVTTGGKKWATYYNAADQALGISYKNTGDTVWTHEVVDAPAGNGQSYPSAAGQFGVMVLNSDDYPTMFYRSLENWLKYFSREML